MSVVSAVVAVVVDDVLVLLCCFCCWVLLLFWFCLLLLSTSIVIVVDLNAGEVADFAPVFVEDDVSFVVETQIICCSCCRFVVAVANQFGYIILGFPT